MHTPNTLLLAISAVALAVSPLSAQILGRAVSTADTGIISFSQNPAAGSYSSAGDGFQQYQVGVSADIPFGVIDDSAFVYPTDVLGIVDTSVDFDPFFGVTDTVNSDGFGVPTATWEFDITGQSHIEIAIDMAAMGDFENADLFQWSYQIDAGSSVDLFALAFNEGASLDYTLASGDIQTLPDPMVAEGITLNNIFQTISKTIGVTGSTLALTLSADTDGGNEAYAFRNIVVSAVPEPSTYGLLVGALILGWAIRRRR